MSSGNRKPSEGPRSSDLIGAEAAMHRAARKARRRAEEVSRAAATLSSPALDPAVLDEVIRRVVKVAQPEKIILFGSAVRGTMTRHSDVDLLIIKEGGDRELSAQIYEGLRGVRVAVDAMVVSPADVERYKDSHALVIKPALQEGKVVYESA